MVLLCVPCGILYKPIKFEPIYDENLSKTNENEVVENNENEKLLIKHKNNGNLGFFFNFFF